MNIYTSYFAKIKALEKNGIVPIGISLYPPKWFDGNNIKFLAPTYRTFSAKTQEEYIKLYHNDVLKKLDIKLLKDIMLQMSKGRDIALLCFESPADFCHRHLLADFLNKKYGYNIEEYVFEKPVKKQVDKGSTLFD
jgi:uncharacterized protein (DUF488 family)